MAKYAKSSGNRTNGTETIRPTASRLEAHPFTRDFPLECIDALAGCSANRDFRKGDYLWRQGDPAETFYLLFGGEVSVGMTTPNEGLVCIEALGAGDLLGWSWILAPHRWHFDAYAITDVRAMGINARCLRERCKMVPELHLELLRRLVPVIDHRLHVTRRKLLDMYAK